MILRQSSPERIRRMKDIRRAQAIFSLFASLSILTTAVVLMLLTMSCGLLDDESPAGAGFTAYAYAGNLSGGATGTFSYRVQDSAGNAEGQASILGKLFFLKGAVTGSGVMLQFQDVSGYEGSITGTESGSSMTGTWYLRGGSNLAGGFREGLADASRVGGGSSGGDFGSCGLQGTWTSLDEYHRWEFSSSRAVLTTKSSDTPGALQITHIDYEDSGSSITYYITRAKMTGGDGSVYYDEIVHKGPHTEAYSISNCELRLGGDTYSR